MGVICHLKYYFNSSFLLFRRQTLHKKSPRFAKFNSVFAIKPAFGKRND